MHNKILVVDDDAVSRAVISAVLTQNDFTVTPVSDGVQALAELNITEPPRIIILDIEMPVMNGYETCRKIRTRFDAEKYYIIMLSGKTDKKEVVFGLTQGADDYVIKPFDSEELLARVKTGRRIIKMQIEMAEKLRIEEERLKEAAYAQRNLNSIDLPVHALVRTAAAYLPSTQLGGDFFHVHERNGKIFFYIGDCEGHGISAAMDSVLVKSVCDRHSAHLINNMPAQFLSAVSSDIILYWRFEKYCTLFAGIIDTDTMKLTYANANAPLPVLFGTKSSVLPSVRGVHIGFDTELEFEEKTIPLADNCRMFVFSDALPEIKGTERMSVLTSPCFSGLFSQPRGCASDEISGLLAYIRDLNTGLPLADDLTLLLFDFTRPVDLQFAVRDENGLTGVLDQIEKTVSGYGTYTEETKKFRVACREMIVNGLTHGNKSDTGKKVTVQFHADNIHAEAVITDDGDGFDPNSVPSPDDPVRLAALLEKDDQSAYTHGRGIFMTRMVMHEVQYSRKGNSVKIVINFSPARTVLEVKST